MAYQVKYESQVEKDLRRLPKEIARDALDRIEPMLKANPFIGEKLRFRDRLLYKYRIRDYRIVYAIDTDKGDVIILRIRHRREVYRGL